MTTTPHTAEKIIGGVTFKVISPVNIDARGKVYRWCTNLLGMEVTIFQRLAGVSFGNHYHKGKDPSRNPERFLLLQGTASFWAYNGITKERVENVVVKEFTEVLIDKGVLHGFTAITNTIFIEYRVTTFDDNHPDMYTADTYDEYITEIKPIV